MITEAEALDKSHADLARRLADAGRKIESDAKVIAALREALWVARTTLLNIELRSEQGRAAISLAANEQTAPSYIEQVERDQQS